MTNKSLKFVMTTTFYPPYHLGGDAVHVYQLSNELAKLGHEVHVIHSVDSYFLKRKNKPEHVYPNHNNVIVHSIKSPLGKLSPLFSYISGSSFYEMKKIKNIIDKVQPDVLHHHNIAGLGPFVLGFKAPNVFYTAHDYWTICPMNGLIRYDRTCCISKSNCFMCSIRSNRPPQLWRDVGLLNKYMQNIDTIITPSNFMKFKLQEFGLKGNFITISNFVVEPPDTGNPLYDFPYFLFVGVLEEHKGILNLIESFIDVKDDLGAKLLIVGSGSLEDEIKIIIAKKECEDQIKMLGRIDDFKLANVYANALAVVIPSIWPENCPLVALEALANGTPIIVSNEGGLPEIANESNAGIIFKNKNNLSSTLMEALNDNTLDTLKYNALKASRQKYGLINFIDSYYSLVRDKS